MSAFNRTKPVWNFHPRALVPCTLLVCLPASPPPSLPPCCIPWPLDLPPVCRAPPFLLLMPERLLPPSFVLSPRLL